MPEQAPASGPPPVAVIATATYLAITSICAGYLVYTLWAPHPSIYQIPHAACDGISKPKVSNAFPFPLEVQTATKAEVIGCLFPAETKITVNGNAHASTWEDSGHISVQFSANDLTSAGATTVGLWEKDKEIGYAVFDIRPASFQWSVFWFGPYAINLELQLLLLVIFMGVLASSLYASKSIADYQGQGKFDQRWILYYLIQPFEGGGVAILFYVLIRGGFLTATGGDVKSVNQFGICAIAGLSGAFSDLAFMKFREVFMTMFKPEDNRTGKLAPLKVVTANLPTGRVGAPYTAAVEASDGTPPRRWSVDPQLPTGLTLAADTGAIAGTPTSVMTATKYKFTVTDSAKPPATATAEISLEITAQ